MRYLKEGIVCIGTLGGAWELLDLEGGHDWAVSEQAARAARRLVRGLEDAEAARAAALVGEGLVEER